MAASEFHSQELDSRLRGNDGGGEGNAMDWPLAVYGFRLREDDEKGA